MTTHPTLGAIRSILAKHPDLETWVGHFEMRLPELAKVERLAGFGASDRVLEVGCGNGRSPPRTLPLQSPPSLRRTFRRRIHRPTRSDSNARWN